MSIEIEITAAKPDEFSASEIAVFNRLVVAGGEVATAALTTNIEAAKALVVGRIEGKFEAVAALKRPQASYRKRIASKAGVDLGREDYPFELGYVFLSPKVRGQKLSHRLVAAALQDADGAAVFATARTDNTPMLRALARAGFEHVGQDYRGRAGRLIRLMVRPQRTAGQ
jgi:predicted GNAT family N-acyltransferase